MWNDQWRAEGVGCPGPTRFLDAHQLKEIFLRTNSCRKFLTTFFVISQILPRFFLLFPQITSIKFWRLFFSHFSRFLLFLSEHLSGCPPYSGSPGPFFTFYAFTLTFSTFTYAFFQKTPSLDAPRVDARGRRTTAPPSATGNDIHKTQTKVRSKSWSSRGRQCWHFPPGFWAYFTKFTYRLSF